MIDAALLRFTLGGLLNSAHCVGMCGAFAIGFAGHSACAGGATTRLVLYNLGRVATYTFLGAAAGLVGYELIHAGGPVWLHHLPGVLAGLIVTAIGLHLLGRLPARLPGAAAVSELFATLTAPLLRQDRLWAAAAFGVFNGFLPCGLVYAFTFEAAAAGSPAGGALTMLFFGLGTLPALILIGLTGARLSPAVRARVLTVGAAVVVALGVWTTTTRAAAWANAGDEPTPACPLCAGR